MEQYNNNFINLINQNSISYDDLCKVLRETNGVIAGSFPLQAILNETWDDSDIDIWVENKTDDIDISPISKFWRMFTPLGYRMRKQKIMESNDFNTTGYKRLNNCVDSIYTFTGNNLKTIQVIEVKPFDSNMIRFYFRNEQEPITMEKFISSFDIKICGVFFEAIDEKTCSLNFAKFNCNRNNDEIINDINSRILNINHNVLNSTKTIFPEWIRTLKRLIKYARRGFTINWDDNIKNVFEECVTDFYNMVGGDIERKFNKWNKKIANNVRNLNTLSNLPVLVYHSHNNGDIVDIIYKEEHQAAWDHYISSSRTNNNTPPQPIDQEAIQNLIIRNQQLLDDEKARKRAAWRRLCNRLQNDNYENKELESSVRQLRDDMKNILNFLNLSYNFVGNSAGNICHDMSEMVSVYNDWKSNIIPNCINEETTLGDELKDLGFGDLWVLPVNNNQYHCFSTEEIIGSRGINFYNREPIDPVILNFVQSIKDFIDKYYKDDEIEIESEATQELTEEQKERYIVQELHSVSYDVDLGMDLYGFLSDLYQRSGLVYYISQIWDTTLPQHELLLELYTGLDPGGEDQNEERAIEIFIEDLYRIISINDNNRETRLLNIIEILGFLN